MQRTHAPVFVCATVLALAVTPDSGAGGFEYEVQGAGTVARSGANVAHVEDPSALYLNVAGIGKLDAVQILVETNLTMLSAGVKLHGNLVDSWRTGGEEYPYMYVENEDKPFWGPMVAGSFGVPGVKGLVLGLGVFGPAAVGDYSYRTWREVSPGARVPGPQRYDLVRERVQFFWPTVALAYRITPRLVVGMGFQWGILKFKYMIVGNTAIVRTPTTYQSDFVSEVDATDWFVPAYLFGVSWRPLDWLEAGLSLRVSDGVDAMSDDLVVTMNPWSGDPIRSDDPTITWMDTNPMWDRPHGRIVFDWPPIKLRSGVRFALPRKGLASGDPAPAHLSEWFDVEVAFFYETSSAVRKMSMQVKGHVPYGRTENQAMVLNQSGDGWFSIQRGWKDSWSVRLGGDVNLWKGRVTVSAGGFYDKGAAPPDHSRLDYLAFDRFGISGGFVVRLWKFDLRVSYVHMFYPERRVGGGKITHLQGLGDTGSVVNNGTYRASIDILTFGALLRI